MLVAQLADLASDRFGRRPVLLFGAACAAGFAFPIFWLVATGDPAS